MTKTKALEKGYKFLDEAVAYSEYAKGCLELGEIRSFAIAREQAMRAARESILYLKMAGMMSMVKYGRKILKG